MAADYDGEGFVADVALVDRLRPGDHLCWTFSEDDERAQVTSRYVGAGLHSGHKVVYFAAAVTPETALVELAAGGAPVGRALDSGQLEVAEAGTNYLTGGGPFDADATSARLHRLVQQAHWDGYPGALRSAAVNELCDPVRVHATPEGTSIRLHVGL